MSMRRVRLRVSPLNPKGFNAAALSIINFVGGDPKTGEHCRCPVCGHKSMSVKNGDKVLVLVHCFKCGTAGGAAIVKKLRSLEVWPTSDGMTQKPPSGQSEQSSSEAARHRYALSIWNALLRNKGGQLAPLLQDYLNARGISRVPNTALIALPPEFLNFEEGRTAVASDDPGMVLPIRNKDGVFQGIHVVWLNSNLTAKRDAQPQRQSFGLIKGNFIELSKVDPEKPTKKLLIAEGAETALAMMQLTGLPGIASSGSTFLPHLDLPAADEYIIGPDCDNDGSSRRYAGLLAQNLVGRVIRIAMPDRAKDSKSGYDWNDALVDAGDDDVKLEKLRRAILEAPLSEAIMTDDERREVRFNALANLKLDDPISYEQQRTIAQKELNVRLSFLDDEVERRCKVLREGKKGPEKLDIELLAASARDIVDCRDVLGLFAENCAASIAGETNLLKVLYLVCTSRLFDKAMNAVIKGPSGGGKSYERQHVLKYFPPESKIEFTTLSEKALLYFKDDYCHKILSMGEARGQDEMKFQDYLLRELMSEGKLRYPVPMKVSGAIETVIVEKHGPVAFMVTTTRNQLHAENETRMLSLEVDDSEAQTRMVLDKIAIVEGHNRATPEDHYGKWHDYQRWLGASECRVRVPFARTLAKAITSTKSVRLRRDFGQLLTAIKAHALLHRKHRKRDDTGAIQATIADDYAAVRTLMADLIAAASEIKVSMAIEETVSIVRKLEDRHNEDPRRAAVDEATNSTGVTVREVADELKLDRSTAQRRLRATADAGLVINLEERKGRAARYQLVGEIPVSVDLLPTPQNLHEMLVASTRPLPAGPLERPAHLHTAGTRR
jgi:DNA-binding transcriptional ArsR family regulator